MKLSAKLTFISLLVGGHGFLGLFYLSRVTNDSPIVTQPRIWFGLVAGLLALVAGCPLSALRSRAVAGYNTLVISEMRRQLKAVLALEVLCIIE